LVLRFLLRATVFALEQHGRSNLARRPRSAAAHAASGESTPRPLATALFVLCVLALAALAALVALVAMHAAALALLPCALGYLAASRSNALTNLTAAGSAAASA